MLPFALLLAAQDHGYTPPEWGGCMPQDHPWSFTQSTVEAAAWTSALLSVLFLVAAWHFLARRPARAAMTSMTGLLLAGVVIGIGAFRLPFEGLALPDEVAEAPVLVGILLLCAGVWIHRSAQARLAADRTKAWRERTAVRRGLARN